MSLRELQMEPVPGRDRYREQASIDARAKQGAEQRGLMKKLEATGHKIWAGPNGEVRVYSGQDYVKVTDEGDSYGVQNFGTGSSKKSSMLAAVNKIL